MQKGDHESGGDSQSLTDHLVALRTCIINSVYGVFLTGILAIMNSEYIWNFMRKPIEPFIPGGGLIFTGVTEKFMAHLKLSILCGLIMSCPWWLYQVWMFVAPGLYKKERKYAVAFLSFGSFLFLLGTAFAYYLVFPLAFKYLLGFGGDIDKPMISVGEYMSFFLNMVLVFGCAFELPMVIVLLAMLGIIDEKFLRTKRRYAVVLLATVSAIITPPDILSMCLMLGPLLVLYELSIIAVRLIAGKREAPSPA